MRTLTAIALAASVTLAGAGLYTMAGAAGFGPGGEGPSFGTDEDGLQVADNRHHGSRHGRWGRSHERGDRRGPGRGEGRGSERGDRRGGELGERMFDRADADDNGVITREEAAAAFENRGGDRFDRFDDNSDGTVSGAEIDAWLAEMKTSILKRFDTNSDGQIDQADRSAMIDQRFARLDADGNGEVSRDEARKVMGDWRRQRREGLRDLNRGFWRGGDQ